MTKSKSLYISTILLLILAFSIWFVILDFTRFFNNNYSYDIFPSAILKRINVILSVAIAWSVGKDGLNPQDSRLMKAALVFAFLGETAFLLYKMLFGICMFAVCQLLLIKRNSTGFWRGLRYAGNKQKLALLSSAFIILLLPAALTGISRSATNIYSSTIIVCIYGFLLSISLWAGLAGCILKLLPIKNSKMAAAGMLCFYCCDILVGLDAALEIGLPWLLANSFIWIFYIPALVLLSLSCYKY